MERPNSIRRDGCHKKNGFVAGSKKKPPGAEPSGLISILAIIAGPQ
jgi:hypothetical protein